MQIEPSSQVSKAVPSEPSVDLDQVKSIIQKYQAMPGAMLPVLHAIQDALGYVPSSAVPLIVVQLCRAEACQAVGADALAAHAKAALGCDFHGTSSDGQFTLEPVYCLGQCACGPSMLIDDDLHARVSSDKFNRLVRAKRGVA
jgi:formate dehydrogenase subunit gamma